MSGNQQDNPLFHIIKRDGVDTLGDLFVRRVTLSGDETAYRQYEPRRGAWKSWTWQQVSVEVSRWQRAFRASGLEPGDRVAVMLPNSVEWVAADLAAAMEGLVTVPLLVKDSPGSACHVVRESGAAVAVLPNASFHARMLGSDPLPDLREVVVIDGATSGDVKALDVWLPPAEGPAEVVPGLSAESLATIVFKAGTMGLPKGVMLSHGNLVWTAVAAAHAWKLQPDDIAVSYLPLAHILERLMGVYASIATGSQIAFCRHPRYLMDSMQSVRPTWLLGVPRVYERIYKQVLDAVGERGPGRFMLRACIDVGWSRFEHQQGRRNWNPALLLWPLLKLWARSSALRLFGGRLRFAFSSGAPLAPPVSRALVGLGIPVLQGYGITEAGLVGTNRLGNNEPRSAGTLIRDVEYRVGPDNEFIIRSPGVMLGYWQDDEATAAVLDAGGWLHTGDKVSRLNQDRLYLTGRIKPVICMSSGQKASPADLEQSLSEHPYVRQVVVIGEALPYLAALVVPGEAALEPVMREMGLSPETDPDWSDPQLEKHVLNALSTTLESYPIYAQIKRLALVRPSWTRDTGMLDENGQLDRRAIMRRHEFDIERLYEGHYRSEKTDSSRNANVG